MRRRGAGFTLVEVMIVTIVIGILATIYIKNYVTIVERQRSAEAISILTQAYVGYQRRVSDGEPTNSLDWAQLGMSDPNTIASCYFTYTLHSSPGWARARAKGSSGSTRQLQLDFDTGVITKAPFYTYRH